MAIITIENNQITKVTEARSNRLEIVGAQMKYLNFSGKPSKYNAEGKRNFEIVIPEEAAQELYDAGWRIRKNGYDTKRDKRRTGDFDEALEDCEYRLRVNVNLDSGNPPRAFKKTEKHMIPLDSSTIGSLDYSEIENVFVEINGYDAAKNGQLSGYLKTIVAEVPNSRFEELYGDFMAGAEEDVPFDI
jgi:hypothetical protein